MNSYLRSSAFLTSVTVALLLSCSLFGQSDVPEQGQVGVDGSNRGGGDGISQQQISYALGLTIGRDLRTGGVKVNLESLVAGLGDGVSGNEPRFTDEVLAAALERFQQQIQSQARRRQDEVADRNKQTAMAFLKNNQKQPGVVQTASGLQYKVLKEGKGPSPTLSDEVSTHYVGTLLDGTEFDSSYRRGKPAKFPVDGVIPGWTEALQKMRVGDKWQLFIPP